MRKLPNILFMYAEGKKFDPNTDIVNRDEKGDFKDNILILTRNSFIDTIQYGFSFNAFTQNKAKALISLLKREDIPLDVYHTNKEAPKNGEHIEDDITHIEVNGEENAAKLIAYAESKYTEPLQGEEPQAAGLDEKKHDGHVQEFNRQNNI